jgi:serine phosphatase RsbU (regulator of sigma subunit)
VRFAGEHGSSELVRAVLDALETFGRHSEPHDDVTMLAAPLVSSGD